MIRTTQNLETRVEEFADCSSSNTCLSPMSCFAVFKCRCPLYQFYDTTSSRCIDQNTYGSTCGSWSNNCNCPRTSTTYICAIVKESQVMKNIGMELNTLML